MPLYLSRVNTVLARRSSVCTRTRRRRRGHVRWRWSARKQHLFGCPVLNQCLLVAQQESQSLPIRTHWPVWRWTCHHMAVSSLSSQPIVVAVDACPRGDEIRGGVGVGLQHSRFHACLEFWAVLSGGTGMQRLGTDSRSLALAEYVCCCCSWKRESARASLVWNWRQHEAVGGRR